MQNRRSLKRLLVRGAMILGATYIAVAYVALPVLWTAIEERVDTSSRVMVTSTRDGIPGDPINVGLVGSRDEVLRAFAEAGWNPADPVTLASGIEIGLSVVLDRPYKDAPISTLIYDGRRQDVAFEKQEGTSADRRHHVRLWLMTESHHGRPLWLGSASFDRNVGISHYTGEVTHHIGPDIDDERDYVIANLGTAGAVADFYPVPGCGPTWEGRNGGGDLYFTDGMALVGILKEAPPGS